MQTLLHLEASPRGPDSASTSAASVFLDVLKQTHRDLAIDRLNLWEQPLPDFDGDALAAKYARLAGRAHTPAQSRAWSVIGELVARLDRADKILISTPMWNFGVPYKLKHFIDLVTQPGLTFSFEPASGYAPLLRPRAVMVILASAGDYSSGRSWGRPDLATGYLREALGFIGLKDPTVVPLGPTAGDPARIDAARTAAHARLVQAAADF